MNKELLTLLKSGYRMEKPDNCSSEMYDECKWAYIHSYTIQCLYVVPCSYEVMLSCWHASVSERPTFTALQATFEMLMSEGDNTYIDFSINPELQYYKEQVKDKESSSETEGSQLSFLQDHTESDSVCIEITATDADVSGNPLAEQNSLSLPHVVMRKCSVGSDSSYYFGRSKEKKDTCSRICPVPDATKITVAGEERYVNNPEGFMVEQVKCDKNTY